MILKELEPEMDHKEWGEVYTRYNGQSLANVPYTIMDALNVKHGGVGIKKEFYKDHIDFSGINKVALIVLDGFGYNLWLDSNNNPGFFNTLSKKGLVIPITAVFPSTTAAGITSVNTGLTPIEHGLPEWVLYMREIGMTINTLPFTTFMPSKKADLFDHGINPKILYNGKTIYQKLKEGGVGSTTLVKKNIANSAYTRLIMNGSANAWYLHPTDGALKLKRLIESGKGNSYTYLYLDNIDATTHNYGPFTEESRAEINSISNIFQVQLLDKVDMKAAKQTIILVTADHGHTTINPDKIVYMKLYGYFATDRGKKILPTGSPRSVFLHITKSKITEAKEYLEEKFAGTARVILSEEAIKIGLFGRGVQHAQFASRSGDIIILPNANGAVWYEHTKGNKHHDIGMHGSLSKNEMLIPLGMARLSDLI